MKVPPYLSIRNPVFTFMRKPLIEGSYIFPLYRYFSHHRKSHSIIQRTKLLDFFIRSGFLMQEIIGRKSDNDKSSFPYFSYNSSNLAYWGVKPHLDATLTTNTFLPLNVESGKSFPSIVLTVSHKNFFAVHQLPM